MYGISSALFTLLSTTLGMSKTEQQTFGHVFLFCSHRFVSFKTSQFILFRTLKMAIGFMRNKIKVFSILLVVYLLVFCYFFVFKLRDVTTESKAEKLHYSFEIRNFTQFLGQCFGNRVLKYSLRPLTKLGDSFGGVLQFVDVKLAGVNGSDEVSWLGFDFWGNELVVMNLL